MIIHLIERLRTSKRISSIVLCTSSHPDDEILVDIAKECGIKYVIGSEEDIIQRFLKAAQMEGAKHVFRVTGDNVLTDPELLDVIAEHHTKTNAGYTRMDDVPIGVAPEAISVETLKECHKIISDDPSKSEYMMFYLYNPDKFHVEVLDPPTELRRPNYSLTIDTPKDLECMRRIFKKFYEPHQIIKLRDVIRFIDEKPQDYTVSSDALIKMPGEKTTTFGEFRAYLKELKKKAKEKKFDYRNCLSDDSKIPESIN